MKIFFKKISSIINDNGFLIPFSVLILYFLIYIIQGENAVITIHDNLDSAVVWRKLLMEAGVLFNIQNNSIVPQVMNGLRRNSFNIGFIEIISLLYYIFPAFWAYIINFCIFKLIGFTGLYLLLKNYIINNNSHSKILSGMLALTFSLLSSYTIYGLASSGLPLILYSILNILNKRNKITSYLYIILYPFYFIFNFYWLCYNYFTSIGNIVLYYNSKSQIYKLTHNSLYYFSFFSNIRIKSI